MVTFPPVLATLLLLMGTAGFSFLAVHKSNLFAQFSPSFYIISLPVIKVMNDFSFQAFIPNIIEK